MRSCGAGPATADVINAGQECLTMEPRTVQNSFAADVAELAYALA